MACGQEAVLDYRKAESCAALGVSGFLALDERLLEILYVLDLLIGKVGHRKALVVDHDIDCCIGPCVFGRVANEISDGLVDDICDPLQYIGKSNKML